MTLPIAAAAAASLVVAAVLVWGAPEALAASGDFVTVWETTAANETITIPGAGTYTVDWGDGTTSTDVSGSQTHEYADAGNHTVTASEISRVFGDCQDSMQKLRSIEQWGDAGWINMHRAFCGATQMTYNATDVPDLSGVKSMSGMFRGASSFNGNVSGWDVSSVTVMTEMFRGASSFNGNVSGWDVSSVTDMTEMFRGASSFNGNVSGWDVSSVTDMRSMFSGASSFNGNVSGWDVSSVTEMIHMFVGATSFNQPLSSWNVSKVTDMSSMFSGATSFNQPLSSWNVSKVTNMNSMFNSARSFDGDLSEWDVSQVKDMIYMFRDATSFNQDLNDWNVSQVTDMRNMFVGATSFNGNLSGWDVSQVTAMIEMFSGATSFNQDLNDWNVSQVTDMSDMFSGATSFNGNLSGWDVSQVTAMIEMFSGATSFNQDLNDWNVSQVTDMSDMFSGATSFNGNLSGWDVSQVTAMIEMFSGATSFNQDLNDWNVSQVIGMNGMFSGATSFNQPLSSWDVSQVTAMLAMFFRATSFDQDISDWDVSKVETMSAMFVFATSFDQNLGNWYVVPAGTSFAASDPSLSVTTISAQNSVLDGHNPVYGIDSGGGSGLFNITGGNTLMFKVAPSEGNYTANVTASGPVFENGSNWRELEITVTGEAADDTPPVITLDGTNPLTIPAGSTYSDPDYSCADDIDNDKGLLLHLDTSELDVNYPGTYTLTYTCTDSSGNKSTVTRTVIVAGPVVIDITPTGNIDNDSSLELSGAAGIATFKIGDDTYAAVAAAPDDGVQILNVTDPTAITATDSIDDSDGSLELDGAVGIATFKIGDNTYAAVTSNVDDGVQILDVTDPDNVIAKDSIVDNGSHMLNGADGIAIFGNDTHTYAAVTGYEDGGVQILDVTDPTAITATDSIDDSDGSLELDGASGIAIFGNSTHTYAAVTAFFDDGVQILNVTDPTAITATDSIDDSDGSLELDGASGIATFKIGTGTYAAVAASTDLGVQILDVTDPTAITATDSIDDSDGSLELDGAGRIAIFGNSTHTYAAVTAFFDDGVQILNVTDPTDITATDSIDDSDGSLELDGASGIATFKIGTGTYAAVAAQFDHGVQVLRLADADPDNNPPVVDAGSDLVLAEGASLALSGNATDQDAGDTLMYSWSQNPATPAVGLSGGTSLTPTITAPSVESSTVITLTLTVNDGTVGVTDEMDITVRDTAGAFITTWETTSADKEITIPGTGTYDVVWGDGSSDDASDSATHAYETPGNHTVSITGSLKGISLAGNSTNAQRLQSIEQWGGIEWTTMESAFRGASNMEYNAADAPDLSGVVEMEDMFRGATAFDGDLSGWDVSGVTSMNGMFWNAAAFNGDLSSWNVSKVTDMNGMFSGAAAFNQPLSSWDVSKVTDMNVMFQIATSFNQPLSSWNVSQVTVMNVMFQGASDFNQDLSSWNVSKVIDMDAMFYGATSFNGDISSWNVSKVTDMSTMFNGASDFNQPLSSWDVSQVTDMFAMFSGATSFDQNLGNWYVVPADTAYAASGVSLNVTTVSAQNSVLDGHSPEYGIGSGGDSTSFNITDANTLMFKATPSARSYTVNVTASGSGVFEGGNNWRELEITVTGETADDTPPVITLVGANPDQVPVDSEYVEPGATCTDDTDPAPSLLSDRFTAIDVDVPGTYTITYTCTDSSGNESTATRTVTVIGTGTDPPEDTTPPVITLNGANPETIPVGVNYVDPVYCTDDTDPAPSLVSAAAGFDVDFLGTYTITYTITYTCTDSSGNESTATREVRVVGADADDTPPAITLVGANPDYVPVGPTYADPGYTCTDDTDTAPTVTTDGTVDTSRPDTYTITYTCTDSSGNESTATREVRVVGADADTTPPAITLVGANPDQVPVGSEYVEPGATCTDDTDPVPSLLSDRFTAIDVDVPGTYTITYICTDSSGNESTATRTVTVIGTGTDPPEGNNPPNVNAGENQTVGEGDTVALSGSAADPDSGDSVESYSWSAPPGSGITFANSSSASTTFTAPAVDDTATFTLTLTASDGTDSGSDSIDVTVRDTGSAFVTTWRTISANEEITIPGTGTYTIDWGDGTIDEGVASHQTHEYEDAGTHTVYITGGLTSIRLGDNHVNAQKLQSIEQWGGIGWVSITKSFQHASNMVYNTTDAPDLSGVTDMTDMFHKASSFDGDLSGWDVSGVTNMTGMFNGASAFNGDVSGWDVSSVTDMTRMFNGASAFNGDVSGWDVSGVTNMNFMFLSATAFDQNLGKWYVVPEDTAYGISEGTLNVTTVSAQNSFLDGHSPEYGIGSGGDSALFNMTDSNTLAFKAAPPAGDYTVNVTASGGAVFGDGNHWRVLDVKVTGSNENPVLNHIGPQNIDELDTLEFDATATDGDDDSLTFTLAGTPPSGASITNDGSFSWTPTELQDGPHSITVSVSDGNGGSDSEAVTVTVAEVNAAPVLNPIGPQSVDELGTLAFTVTATDGDVIGGDPDTLKFSLTGTVPAGATMDPATGLFSWTPAASQAGRQHTITIQVEDGGGATDSEQVTVTVTESGTNEPPVLNRIGPQNIDELDTLEFDATATDGDDDSLTFTLAGTPPSGASITNDGSFSWTPTELQDGPHSITVSVSDGNGGSDSEAVTVTVAEVNAAPVLNPIGPQSVDELGTLAFTVTATDGDVIGGDPDTLEFSLTGTVPAGASIDSATGLFTWTPTEAQDGSHTITVSVSDGTEAYSQDVQVEISEVNRPPTLAVAGSHTVNELSELAFEATAADADLVDNVANTLEFSLTGTVPAGASIDSATGLFTWTPTEAQDGSHTITVSVSDGTEAYSQDVQVEISEVNRPPTLAVAGSHTVNELSELAFEATAADADLVDNVANTLEFSLTGTVPAGASIDSATGLFTWTPTEAQDGSHTITVSVSDGTEAYSQDVQVEISEVNRPPTLAVAGSHTVNELSELAFEATAADADLVDNVANTLEFSLTGTVPAGASIDSATGLFTWTPTEAQDGSHTITVSVSDGNGGSDSEAVTVTVAEVNAAPVLNPIGPQSVDELGTLAFTVTATDGDVIGGDPDTLEFSLTGTVPTGATMDPATGLFSWTPAASQEGRQHTITIQVEDGGGLHDSGDVTVTVGGSNENPMLGFIGQQSVNELGTLAFTATATDGDAGDSLTFTLAGTPPAGASIGRDSGSFSWTPTELQDGAHTVTVRVEDGNGGSDSEAVTVTVAEVNEPPVLNTVGLQSVNRPGTLAFTVTASDGDVIGGVDDALEFSLTGTVPAGTSIGSVTGSFSWTPTASQAGRQHTITIQVEDGRGATDSEQVTVTVTESGTNEPPVLGFIGPQSIDELDTLEFDATATDADADSLTFSLGRDPPRGASITNDGSFSWTPDQSQDGTHSITVQVSDGRGGTDSQEVTVTVYDIEPVQVSARSSGSSITLTLSEVVTSSGADPNSFSVEAGGDPVSVDSITGSGTKSLVLGLSGPISAPATLSYSGSDVTDENGLRLGEFSDLPVSFQSKKSRPAAAPPAITADSPGYSFPATPEWARQAAAPEGPVEPVPADGTFTYPLTIDQNGYALLSSTSTVIPTNVTAGQTVTISVAMHDATPIAYFAIYLHLQGNEISHLDSDAQVIWNNGDVYVIDPGSLMQDVTVTVSEDPDDPAKKTATVTFILSEGMGETNLVIKTWNAAGQLAEVRVFDAIAVTAPGTDPEPGVVDPEPGVVDPEPTGIIDAVDPEPGAGDDSAGRDLLAIRMWSGFEPESISDAQLLATLGLDYPGADIPSWVMTKLGVLAAKGDVTAGEFRTALEYVLEAR